jgi:CRISPR/Cas system-associated protein Cas7 (RAMP superfamily)
MEMSEWVTGEQGKVSEWVTGEQGEGSKRVMSLLETLANHVMIFFKKECSHYLNDIVMSSHVKSQIHLG